MLSNANHPETLLVDNRGFGGEKKSHALFRKATPSLKHQHAGRKETKDVLHYFRKEE